tara:strand:- start:25 stop:351 length:327 start_codon:yes stop_codon:yes gene_type:complete
MKDPEIIEREVREMTTDRNNWKMGKEFRDCNAKEFEVAMEEKYKYLKESSKTLFKNVLNNTVNQEKYEFLLYMMKQVFNKDKTPEQADTIVGETFSKEYIEPLIKDKN